MRETQRAYTECRYQGCPKARYVLQKEGSASVGLFHTLQKMKVKKVCLLWKRLTLGLWLELWTLYRSR